MSEVQGGKNEKDCVSVLGLNFKTACEESHWWLHWLQLGKRWWKSLGQGELHYQPAPYPKKPPV